MTDPLHQILSDIGGLKAEAVSSTNQRRLLFAKLDDQNAVLATHGRMLAEIKTSLEPLSANVQAHERKIDALESARQRLMGLKLAAGITGSVLTTAAAGLAWMAEKAGWFKAGGS